MKTFRMIGMALAAILMCVNLASCDEDDDESREASTNTTNNGGNGDNDSNGGNSEKRLAKVMIYDLEVGSKVLDESYEFVYGSNGNVVKTIEGYYDDGSWQTDIYEYKWNSNKSFTLQWDEEEADEFILEEGKVVKRINVDKGDEEVITTYFDYEKGYIKEFRHFSEIEGNPDENESWISSFSWVGGRLSSVYDEGEMTTFLYSDQTCKRGFFPLFSDFIEDIESFSIFMAHPELVGLRTTQLPSEMTGADITFKYEFDSEGYVIGCTEFGEDVYYSFFWE